ncbi:hypothetical protein LMH87_003826 [Akanthomyces muscarius]|uniref:Uncharacterized protein n=1 Tax=Akanthomyces muscarius TaxID=2231603 RepID=A0A9W8UHH2_AKAMU|nr:hypothetical protein LMH87_003826 [Akanthomyces muscarius]KAJ4144959.1 hypothetical protein LMH87_003826 [Akanthomyces muscarius]
MLRVSFCSGFSASPPMLCHFSLEFSFCPFSGLFLGELAAFMFRDWFFFFLSFLRRRVVALLLGCETLFSKAAQFSLVPDVSSLFEGFSCQACSNPNCEDRFSPFIGC